jgi:phosphoesterase RecJ-like protein
MELLFEHRAYNIVGHVRPDGDCVGSQLAICNVLRAENIICNILKNDDYGSILAPFFDGYTVLGDDDFDEKLPLICVDCATLRRVGTKIASLCPNPYLNIDHHISNENFAEYNAVDANASSTAQVVAEAAIHYGLDIDSRTAEALYLGIMTDTNRFAYDTTSLDTIKIVEVLMGSGISISKIYQKVYERDSLQKYSLLERFLRNMEVFAGGLCCASFVTEADFKETGAEPLATEGFVNYTRGINGVEIGAFLEFHDSNVKCSVRSKNAAFRMDIFAKQFGGGGHPAASGFTTDCRGVCFYEDFKLALAKHVKNFTGTNSEY